MSDNSFKELAAIQYVGLEGISSRCKNAVIQLVQSQIPINQVYILSNSSTHALLLNIDVGDYLAVKSGFASCYRGEGASALSYVLSLLLQLDIPIREYEISQEFLSRLDSSALTNDDIKSIEKGAPPRSNKWPEYLFERHRDQKDKGTLWHEIEPILPLGIIDQRINDLAIDFWEAPGDKIFQGYKRLEEIVRNRTGLNEHGSSLFSKAFLHDDSLLHWQEIDSGEQTGRANLFTGTYMAFRNPKAHSEQQQSPDDQVSEFLLLNNLFRLEDEAVLRKKDV